MKIDAHQHYWKLARGDYGWLTPEKGPIYRDFMPADLAPYLAKHGIDRTILVQAAPTEAETKFLLQIAFETQSVAGVVGWLDFEAPDVPERIRALAGKHDRLVGLRPMLHDIVDPEWLLKHVSLEARIAMYMEGIALDALVRPRHLSVLAAFMSRNGPGPTVVIDHCAKPELRDPGGAHKRWQADMAARAARGAWCKLSGLVTEAPADWTVASLESTVRFVLEVFGPEKIIWGSDWPVVDLGGGYDRWHAVARELAGIHPRIFGENAHECYLSKRGRNW
ncbi:MAG: amidohydrolase family protein [Tagaea sp.]